MTHRLSIHVSNWKANLFIAYPRIYHMLHTTELFQIQVATVRKLDKLFFFWCVWIIPPLLHSVQIDLSSRMSLEMWGLFTGACVTTNSPWSCLAPGRVEVLFPECRTGGAWHWVQGPHSLNPPFSQHIPPSWCEIWLHVGWKPECSSGAESKQIKSLSIHTIILNGCRFIRDEIDDDNTTPPRENL